MKNHLLLILLVSVFAGCKPKEQASTPSPVPEAEAPQRTDILDASNQNPAGNWTGAWESKSPQPATVEMELLLSKHDEQWKGECRFTLNGNNTSNTRNVTVENGRVSFRCDFASDSEFRFSGELTGGRIQGFLEILEHDQKVASGTWNVTKAKE